MLAALWGAAIAIRVFIVLPRGTGGLSAFHAGQLAGGCVGLALLAWGLYAFFTRD